MRTVIHGFKFGLLRFSSDSAEAGPGWVQRALEQGTTRVKKDVFETEQSLLASRSLQTCLVRTSMLDAPAIALTQPLDNAAHPPPGHSLGVPIA